jgi:hypothetical protein
VRPVGMLSISDVMRVCAPPMEGTQRVRTPPLSRRSVSSPSRAAPGRQPMAGAVHEKLLRTRRPTGTSHRSLSEKFVRAGRLLRFFFPVTPPQPSRMAAVLDPLT